MRFKPPRLSRLRSRATVRSPDDGRTSGGTFGHDAQEKAAQSASSGAACGHRKAKIAALSAIAVLILGTAPVTYSYLTASSETVVNTFAGGAISLTLDEAKVDTDGNVIDGEARVQENSYKVVPGTELSKDPTVTVLKGSEVCYVYLYVENPLDEAYFTPDYRSEWIRVAATGTRTLYVYRTTVDAADGDVTLTPIFTTISVSSDLTSVQIEAMGQVQIKVQAYAVQAAGIDSATGIQMAADYFASAFDFAFTDVDTAVEIGGTSSEEDADKASSSDGKDAANTASSGTESDAASTEETFSDTESGETASEETVSDDTAADSSESSESTEEESGTDSGGISEDTAALTAVE